MSSCSLGIPILLFRFTSTFNRYRTVLQKSTTRCGTQQTTMFALNRLTASAFHVFRYRSAPAIQSFCHGFTSTSSNCDDDKKQWRREYNARYYLENRERLREAKSKQYHKNIEKSRQKNNDYLDKMEKEDPERLERRVRQIREILASKYRDPEWRQRELIRRKQQYRDNHAYKQRLAIGNWLVRRCPDPGAFTWKTHTPIVYPEVVRHTCASCKIRRRRRRLWWRRNSTDPEKQTDSQDKDQTNPANPELFDCHGCYTKDMSDMGRLMPVGHENHVFGIGMKSPTP